MLKFLEPKNPAKINKGFLSIVAKKIEAAEATEASGPSKHQAVVDYILDEYRDDAVGFLNSVIDIPHMPEKLEAKLIDALLGVLIKVLVWAMSEFLWKSDS